MSDAPRPLILDADGVFLSERPYWNAALGTALASNGLSVPVAGRWDVLADYAFGPVGLQRVTKVVGCNSNWDLAAVLVRALDDRTWRRAVADFLEAGERELEAMQTLRAAARRLHDERAAAADPLGGFGIERDSAFFAEVVETFQRVLHGEAGLGWTFETWQLKEGFEPTSRVFGSLRDAGYTLRVCTGRHRKEIEAPIRALDLEPYLTFSEITSSDEVDRAEETTGLASLGKPHWFAPACATVGYKRALAALPGDDKLTGAGVYVGDALADFLAVEACRSRGLELRYVHARSGVTTRDQEQAIGASAATLGIVSSLTELGAVLPGAGS